MLDSARVTPECQSKFVRFAPLARMRSTLDLSYSHDGDARTFSSLRLAGRWRRTAPHRADSFVDRLAHSIDRPKRLVLRQSVPR